MRTLSKPIALVALIAAAHPALAQQAGTLPYFRFNLGKGQGPVSPDPGTNTGALSISSNNGLPSGPVGTPVSSRFTASGGTPPYRMSLVNAPAGITFAGSGSTWLAGGALSPAGAFRDAAVVVTDSAGGTATLPVPVTVTDGTTQPSASLAFSTAEALPSGRVGTRVRSYYSATGGTTPYAMTLVAGPPGVTLSKLTSDTWTATGSLAAAGSYQTALVNLVDGKGGPGVTFPVPVTVDGPTQPLAFTSTQDLPPSFRTFSKQTAAFAVGGGVAPYAWSLASAPTTIVASGSAQGAGSVVGVVEQAGHYSGVTLTVTDAAGDSVVRTLGDFDVTDEGGQGLTVTGLNPLPARLAPGKSTASFPVLVGGATPDGYQVNVQIVGGPPSAQFFAYGANGDKAQFYAFYTAQASEIGTTYDASVLFTDANDPTRTKLVPWGKVTIGYDPFVAADQYPDTITGLSGETQTVYAHVRGGSRNASVAVNGPASVQAYGQFYNCGYTYCNYTLPTNPGDDMIGVTVTIPDVPGTYTGVQVVATDNGSGERAYFEPITVVAKAQPKLEIVSGFPTPNTVEGSDSQGSYLQTIIARYKGGSPSTTATVSAPDGVYLYTNTYDCSSSAYYCSQYGVGSDEKIVELSGSLPRLGTFSNIVVTLADASSQSSVTFPAVTVNVVPPAFGSCAFKGVSSFSDDPGATGGAVSFRGGQGPYTITSTGVNGLTFDAPTDTGGANYIATGRTTNGTQAGTASVTVTDSKGATCSGQVEVKSYTRGSGDFVSIMIDRGDHNGLSKSPLALPDSTPTLITTDYGIKSYEGPVGVHPSPYGIHLIFVPADGAQVTGYMLAANNSPISESMFGPMNYYNDGFDPNTSLYIQNLHWVGIDQLPSGDYTYSYVVFLSDGTYRPVTPFTVRVN